MKEIFKKYKLFDIDVSKLRSPNFYKNFIVNERKIFWKERSILNKKTTDSECLLCGNKISNSSFLNHEGYELTKCKNCELVFANILLDDTYTKSIYDTNEYEESTKIEILDTYDYRKNKFGKERFEYLEEKCNFTKNDTLLDLGCGPGYFLKYLDELKIKSKGLEVTDYLVNICKENNLNVENKYLEYESKLEYNVITMFDVLEHLRNPIELFNQANDKIKKDGFVLAYTPNIHSFSFAFQEGSQNLLLPYEHLGFYNKKSLDYLAEKTGFKVVSIDYYGLDMVDYLSMKEYEDNIDYNSKLQEIIPYMQALIDDAKISNHMRIVFQKVK